MHFGSAGISVQRKMAEKQEIIVKSVYS